VRLDGRRVRITCPDHAVARGVFLIPEERRSQGVLVDETVRANITLPFLAQFARPFGFVSRRLETRHTRTTIDNVGLTPPNPEMVVANLSGGNQQKVAIGKWFGRPPRVMMFDEATQGIDVKAKRDVYRLAQGIADRAAVIYASSEIDEVVGLADRVLVMRDGRVVAELTGDDIDRNLILEHATGARPSAKNPAEQGAR
jgi:simple sugar transport system ATP-binding protein